MRLTTDILPTSRPRCRTGPKSWITERCRRRFTKSPLKWLGGSVILFNFLLILGTPTAGLLWLSLMPFTQTVSRRGFALLTLENFRTVAHSTFYLDLVWQTLLMSAGAATCVMALTVVAGWREPARPEHQQ